jgi:uncharacterized protein YnzC (UPF0291/DUF896 family)
VNGESSQVGWAKVYIDKVKIYDPDGNDVTSQFKIIRSVGKMQVYLYKITIRSGGATKVYDGTNLTNSNYSIESGALADPSHKIKVKCTGNITDVISVKNKFDVTITDGNGQDITSQYYVYKKYGTLEVVARDLHVTVNDARKKYDGIALESDSYSIPDM